MTLFKQNGMYPKDNVFQIYYNIGKRLPFQVKRSPLGLKGSYDETYRYSQEGRTFMVESLKIRNKTYGTAYGYCMIDGLRDDNNEYMKSYEDGTVPCAGCGGWVLIDIPGVDMNEVFPIHGPEFTLQFGKYKGETIAEVYIKDPQYILWLTNSDRYFRIDINALKEFVKNDEQLQIKSKTGIKDASKETTIDDTITFGKYKGLTYRDVYDKDPNYINWALENIHTIEFDLKSFENILNKKNVEGE